MNGGDFKDECSLKIVHCTLFFTLGERGRRKQDGRVGKKIPGKGVGEVERQKNTEK